MSLWLTSAAHLATRQLAVRAAIISAAIVAVVLAADYVLNVWLMPGVSEYTPFSTLAIVLLVAPPIVLALLLQTEKVRRTQQDLAREQAARISAEAVNTARTRFLANISHELRTPLNGIIGYSELMAETAAQEERDQDVADHGRVMTGAKRLLHLLNDLLDLAKAEAGRLSFTPAEFNVRGVLSEAADLVRPDIERNRNHLVIDIDHQIANAHTDASRLSQAVLNLLTNAAKFTSDGTITLTAKSHSVNDIAWLEINVADTGIGIAPDRQVLLFEPFMQAEVSGASPGAGAGLGLALTRQVAALLGGEVALRSVSGEGSCFTLRVPLRGPAQDTEHKPGKDAAAITAAA